MLDLKARFDAAVANSRELSERPDNATLLRLYALYKQASVGDNPQQRPGMSDPVGRAKWEAWQACRGRSSEDAMRQYIELIDSLS